MEKLKAVGASIKYFLIFCLAPMICGLLVPLIYALFSANVSKSYDTSGLSYLTEIISCSLIIVIYFVLHRTKKLNFTSSVQLNRIKLHSAVYFIFLGFALFFVCMLANLVNLVLGGALSSNNSEAMKFSGLAGTIFFFLAKSVFVPLAEEITFRGLIYSRLKKAFPTWACVLITSLVFGVMHGGYSVFSVLTAALMSALYIYFKEKYNSIVPGFLAHAAYNFTLCVLKLELIDMDRFEIPLIIFFSLMLIISAIGIIVDIKSQRKLNGVTNGKDN